MNKLSAGRGHNEWPAFLRELLNDEVGTSALAGSGPGWIWAMGRPAFGRREEGMLAWWWWRYNVRCGRVSALRFHLCNLPSIVQVYYQLFNYSDDIYQGQLHRAASCRENGQSVSLLHSHAEECAAEAVQVGGHRNLLAGLVPSGRSVSTLSGVTINDPLWFLTHFSIVYIIWLPQ